MKNLPLPLSAEIARHDQSDTVRLKLKVRRSSGFVFIHNPAGYIVAATLSKVVGASRDINSC